MKAITTIKYDNVTIYITKDSNPYIVSMFTKWIRKE